MKSFIFTLSFVTEGISNDWSLISSVPKRFEMRLVKSRPIDGVASAIFFKETKSIDP